MSKENCTDSNILVSIICRTIGREELSQALNSIADQSYAHIELILVNASRANLDQFDLGRFNAVVVNPESTLNRSGAANAGLDASNGDYLMFLDDDDWIASNHVNNLLSIIDSQQSSLAAYSACVKTTADGKDTGTVFDQYFDPFVLMRDNYIPINSALFSRVLLKMGCRFDESFDIYEDWDFWLQVSQNTSFIHSDERTAFYRAGGDSDTATNDDGERFQTEHRLGKARAALFNKWKGKWGGEAINQMLKSAIRPDLAKKVSELANRLEEELKKSNLLETGIHERDAEIHERDAEIRERNAEIRERNAEIRERNQKLDQLRLIENSLRQKIDSFAREINSLRCELNHKIEVEKNLKVHIGQLEAELNRVLSSKSWRVMGPIRRIGRFLTNGLKANRSRTSDAEQAEPKVNEVETKPDVTETILVTEKNAKEKYDEEAKSALDSFLDSKERLNFEKTGVPSVSIILVLYNQAQLSFLCLKSLLQKSDVAFELIIVDNASSDKTKELLAKIDNAIILHNQKNLGFVKAVNKAAGVAKTDFLLLLNNDALIHKRTLSYALDTLAIDETVGAVGGKIVLTDGTLQEAGSIIWQDGSCLGYGRGDDPDAAPYMFERDVDYCSGAFLLFRRNDFEELNGFDEDYAPAYYEDSDFCIRLQKKGFRIIYNPNVVITHYEFASSGGLSNASILQKKHQNIFCNKHSEWLKTKRSRDPQTTHLARTSNQFPNVLVIDDRIPHPSLGSGYPRAAHFVNSIDELELNVSFYPLQFPHENWEASYGTLKSTIEIVMDEGREGLRSFLASRKKFYKYIIVSRAHNMAFFNEIIDSDPSLKAGTKIIYDAEALTAPREILQKQIRQELIPKIIQDEMVEKEIRQASVADLVIAVSNKEAAIYRKHGVKNILVLGHTIHVSAGPKNFQDREGLLFVGALRDEGSPNVDSLLWFIINVLPYIEESIPDIKLYVVGDKSAPSLTSIEKPNISFMGRLETLDDIYNDRRVFIAPTRFAAGIPHKVHEAAAVGIPCVATPLLAHQLDWQHEKELLAGVDPEDFANQCLRLYKDERLWGSIRNAGLTSVAKDCSVENFWRNLNFIFD